MTTDLSNVSAIQARKVLDSPRIIGSKELLEPGYEMGDYPYPEKSAWKSMRVKSNCCKSGC